MLKALLLAPIVGFLGLYVGWVFYLAVMALSRARREGTLTPWTTAFGLPVLWVGLVLDALLNATVLSVIFWERPKEWTMTARLKRHMRYTNRPRSIRIVRWFKQFVDPFDPRGSHL